MQRDVNKTLDTPPPPHEGMIKCPYMPVNKMVLFQLAIFPSLVLLFFLGGAGYVVVICIFFLAILLFLSMQLYPRRYGIKGEFLIVKWLHAKKSFHLSSIEGIHLHEVRQDRRSRHWLTETPTEIKSATYYAVISIRGCAPLTVPLWKELPKSSRVASLAVISYLSELAAMNAEREASDYRNSEIKMVSPQNFYFRALGGMVIGILWVSASITSFMFFKSAGGSSRFGINASFVATTLVGVIIFAVFTALFILRFTKPGIGISLAGARKLRRLRSDPVPTGRVWVELSVFNWRNIAFWPQLIVKFSDQDKRSLVIPAQYDSFFPAVRMMRKWPKDRFGVSISRYKVGTLNDSFRAAVERIRYKRIDGMKSKRIPISAVDADTLKMHILMEPEELLKSHDNSVESEPENGKR